MDFTGCEQHDQQFGVTMGAGLGTNRDYTERAGVL